MQNSLSDDLLEKRPVGSGIVEAVSAWPRWARVQRSPTRSPCGPYGLGDAPCHASEVLEVWNRGRAAGSTQILHIGYTIDIHPCAGDSGAVSVSLSAGQERLSATHRRSLTVQEGAQSSS